MRGKEGKLDFCNFEKGDLWENPTAPLRSARKLMCKPLTQNIQNLHDCTLHICMRAHHNALMMRDVVSSFTHVLLILDNRS